jgi:hypothetical protein
MVLGGIKMVEKKKYEEPTIIEKILIIEDIIALSNKGVLGDIFDDDGEKFGG